MVVISSECWSGSPQGVDRRISELTLVDERESQQQIVEWNRTQRAYREGCVHELIAEHAKRTPDAVALVCGSKRMSYAELDARSNQLARYLRSLGAGPEVIVGLCMERSLEMVIGLLGILKSGAAYLPLDPRYPGERLAYMLDDARVPVLLTQRGLQEQLPVHAAKVIRLDTDWRRIGREIPTH